MGSKSLNVFGSRVVVVFTIYIIYVYRYYIGLVITTAVVICWINFLLVFIHYNVFGGDIFLVMKRPVISNQLIDLIYNYLNVYVYNIQYVRLYNIISLVFGCQNRFSGTNLKQRI